MFPVSDESGKNRHYAKNIECKNEMEMKPSNRYYNPKTIENKKTHIVFNDNYVFNVFN